MKDILQTRDAVVSLLKAQKSKDDRFRELVKLGKELEGLSEVERDDKFLIKGCLSAAWLIPSYSDGHVFFKADSEAVIVKGIISVLIKVYSGQTPADILSLDASFLKDAGIEEALSMNRRSGLANMIKQIKLYAVTYQALHQTN